jgi:hypothetical protein
MMYAAIRDFVSQTVVVASIFLTPSCAFAVKDSSVMVSELSTGCLTSTTGGCPASTALFTSMVLLSCSATGCSSDPCLKGFRMIWNNQKKKGPQSGVRIMRGGNQRAGFGWHEAVE